MLVLSLGDVWSVVSRLDVPLLGVERVPTRFIVMPLMVWLIALMAGMHEWTTAMGRLAKTAVVIGLPLVTYELLRHAEEWRIALAEQPTLGGAPARLWSEMAPDRAYAAAVYGSWTVSALAWMLIGATWLRRRKHP